MYFLILGKPEKVFSLNNTIIHIGFVQALFGMLIFLSKRPAHFSFKILVIWFAVIAIFLGTLLLPFQVVDYFKPGVFPLLFLFGPLLYFYVRSLAVESFQPQWKQLFHLTPLILVAIHRSFSNAVSISSSALPGSSENIYNRMYFSLAVISMIVYWIFSIQIILKHRKNIPFYFSNYSKKNTLTWLFFVIALFFFLFLSDLLVYFLERLLETKFVNLPFLEFNLTVFAFIMLFFGINQTVIYEPEELKENGGKNESKYDRSAMSKDEIEKIRKLIFNYLKERKPYLNSEYNLQMMVTDLNISRQKLSQVINLGEQKNFYQLINEFRIEEVKTRMTTPGFEHYTLLGIAFECGFNSKTSFNRIFKEITGLTPSEYKSSV
ncbi:MAG: helix-turn-helix domain-containing protein [Draconibacterium sp.]